MLTFHDILKRDIINTHSLCKLLPYSRRIHNKINSVNYPRKPGVAVKLHQCAIHKRLFATQKFSRLKVYVSWVCRRWINFSCFVAEFANKRAISITRIFHLPDFYGFSNNNHHNSKANQVKNADNDFDIHND